MDKTNINQQDTYKNVEYLAVKKLKKQLMLLEADEANGMTRTQLSRLIGDKLGEGTFTLVAKYVKNPKIFTGHITSIITNKGTGKGNVPDFSHITDQMRRMEEKFENNSHGADFTAIMQMKDQAYQIQIDFYKAQIEIYKAEIEKLRRELAGEGGGNNGLLDQLIPILVQSLTKPGTT